MNFRGDQLLRFLGLLIAIAMIADGILCFDQFCAKPLRIRDYVASFIVVVSGILLLLAEINHWLKEYRFSRVLHKVLLFLVYRSGRGVFFLISGALCLNENNVMLVIGGLAMLMGVINLLVAFFLHKVLKKDVNTNMELYDLPNTNLVDEFPDSELRRNAV